MVFAPRAALRIRSVLGSGLAADDPGAVLGRHTRTLKPGVTILTPFIKAVGRKARVMEQVLDEAPSRRDQIDTVRPA